MSLEAGQPGGAIRHVVFYGSLMEGLTLPGKPDLALLGAARVGPARIHAELWDTRLGYPALVRPGDPGAGVVHGELWALADPAGALPVLDAFEGLHAGEAGLPDEERSEYLRAVVRCLEPAGVEAWVYVWNGTTAGMERVEGGDWRERAGAA